MATAGSLIQDVRRMFGDPDGEFISDTIGLEWLTIAQERFCQTVMPIDEIKDYTITARIQHLDLPANAMPGGITRVVWLKDMTHVLESQSPAEFERIMAQWPNGIGRPVYYTVFRRQIVVGPQSPNSDSATALGSGALASTASTINLTAASGTFRSPIGYLYNQTTGEVVRYASLSTTQVGVVTRGVHGTPATAGVSGDRWMQVDLQVHYRALATAVTATTSTPEIPVMFHRYLQTYMLYKAWLARGDAGKAQVIYNEFETLEKAAKESVGQRMLEPMSIKDRRGRTFRGGYW